MIPIMRPWLGSEEGAAAAEVISSGWIAQGPRVERFEHALAARVGASDGIAVTSCTTALHLALIVLGVGPADEVIVPSLSFIATANAARYVAATPVFADVEIDTLNLSARTIERVLTPATRAVILVHQGGTPADLDEIHRLCDPRGIAVIEDAACAIGATYKGRPIGGHSDLVAFSFHPRKVITTGEGGMLMTSNPDWAERLRRLREHGMNMSAAARHSLTSVTIEQYLETGYNYRMTDIQAAVGLVQLGRLDEIVARRRRLAERYGSFLDDIPGIAFAKDPAYGTTNYQSFWLILPEEFPVTRNDLMARMLERGISTRRGIMAAHLEPPYATSASLDLPVTERLDRQAVLLPLYHEMTEEDQDGVMAVIQDSARLAPGRTST